MKLSDKIYAKVTESLQRRPSFFPPFLPSFFWAQRSSNYCPNPKQAKAAFCGAAAELSAADAVIDALQVNPAPGTNERTAIGFRTRCARRT